MKKDLFVRKYIEFFKRLLIEKDIKRQQKIAKEIADFSSKINDEIEKEYYDETLQKIQNSCLSMEHWKDETGYCNLTKRNIRDFLRLLKKN